MNRIDFHKDLHSYRVKKRSREREGEGEGTYKFHVHFYVQRMREEWDSEWC